MDTCKTKTNQTVKMFPIAQITWIRYTNFGTSLQAYALQKTLERLGYNSRIIFDDRFTNIQPQYNSFKKLLGAFIHPKRAYLYYQWWSQTIRPFDRFANKHLKLDKRWRDIEQLDSDYACFICGSDQIWSPILPSLHNGFYFAAFTNKPKIAYAPSIGVTDMSDEYISQIRPWVTAFSAISLREQRAADIFMNRLGVSAISVLDPTLLLSKTDWAAIAESPSIKMKYVLAYFLTYNEVYCQAVVKWAETNDLILIAIGDDARVKSLSHIPLRGIGPAHFLGLISNAEYVITDSFHCTIFSIQFSRPFVALKRFFYKDKRNQNDRIDNLYNLIGITYFPDVKEVSANGLRFCSDFDSYRTRILPLRSRSIEFLQTSLSDTNI